MQLYKFYAVWYGGRWKVYHNWHLEYILEKGWRHFGIDGDTRQEARKNLEVYSFVA